MHSASRKIKIVIALLIVLAALVLAAGFYMNYKLGRAEQKDIAARISSRTDVLTEAEISKLQALDPQCAVVLGAGIINSTTPSPMLKDRLDTGIMLYNKGIVKKLLLSGDNGTVEHNELHVMLYYCKTHGVKAEDIFCDHAGFSTYETFCRAKSVFQVDRALVVTQSYHLTRALYDAQAKGIKALGVASDQEVYSGSGARNLREIGARIKDYIYCAINKKPTYGGDPIPITGSGVSSHGE
ncbi:MAG: ElyC/SanA/YdcF family protein [Eubacteriales bacterium]|nr:ElyC/SanA/YdcF family protein [Eubacteriales bacterium]